MKELDGFVLTEALGAGSNSKVYLGVPADTLNRDSAVACKILNEEANKGKDTLARYGREIRIAHKLDHPGIVKMYSWGEQSNLLFIIMEYVEGGTLADLIKPDLPLSEAYSYMGQIATALQHAHENDIVHRDIKPANILMQDGFCKISDFGLGRALQDDVSLTKEGTVLGTPAYIAPEQIQGKKPTAACDQYALGVLFYELLTGVRPFISNDSVALLMMQLQESPVDPRTHRAEIPEKVSAVVLRMMEKDPKKRFPSVRKALAALRLATDDEDEAVEAVASEAAG
ncbi:MAG TPA: serine/threonine protein kinase [Phycisphaerales bacterium]|nr:serine/threonine protein kinase [Phycisphaerales bacterium]